MSSTAAPQASDQSASAPKSISTASVPPAPSVPGPFVSLDALRQRPLRTVTVPIPTEFGGGTMKLRALKQSEREKLDDDALKREYKDDGTVKVELQNLGFKAKALAMSMVQPDGVTPYFPSVEEGMAVLGGLDDAFFDVLFEPCDRLNILTADARKALGKDSGQTPSNNSSSK